jgi:hypothetical protein
MAIDWDRIGQHEFDRRVEALLYRMFNGSTGAVIAVNGRGGDDGIDVQVSTDTGIRVFQLKYYPDGFPGSVKGRRAAIKKSFNRAMRHDPVEWTLVVPGTLTPSERSFVDRLAQGHTVAVSVLDRPGLDNGFADYPGLEATFTRDQLREAARDFNQEKALLLDQHDLVERVRALGARADTVDEDWTWDFERRGDLVVRTLRQQHPLAHERSPITMRVAGRTAGMSTDLTAAINRTLGFGIAEEVILPPHALESLTIEGPEFIAQRITDATLTWKPISSTAGAGATAEISFLTSEGTVAARHSGRVRTIGSGGLGFSIDADIHSARFQMMLPFDRGNSAKIRFNYELKGCEPGPAIKILRLQQRLLRGGDVRLTIDGAEAGSGTLPSTGTTEELRHIQDLVLYLSDLDVVQRHCEAYFPAPLVYTGKERIDLRVARLLIEGRCVAYPFAQTFTCTLNGKDDPGLRALLKGQPQGLRISPPSFEVTVGEHRMEIGRVNFFHTRIRIDESKAVLEALNTRQAQGHKITLRPEDGECFRLYLEDATDDGLPLTPTPLGLEGYKEAK